MSRQSANAIGYETNYVILDTELMAVIAFPVCCG